MNDERQNRRIRLGVLIGLTALAGACATGVRYEPGIHPETLPGTAMIYVYRVSVLGPFIQPAVRLNGEKITKLSPRGYSIHRAAPGRIELSSSTESESSVVLDAEAGETYFVRGKLRLGMAIGRPELEVVDAAEAAPQLSRCRLLEKWSDVRPEKDR